MTKEKEMTAPVVSVGADTEQSSRNLANNSLTDFDTDFKGFDEMQREILRMMDPSYLKTVSMSELLDMCTRASRLLWMACSIEALTFLSALRSLVRAS